MLWAKKPKEDVNKRIEELEIAIVELQNALNAQVYMSGVAYKEYLNVVTEYRQAILGILLQFNGDFTVPKSTLESMQSENFNIQVQDSPNGDLVLTVVKEKTDNNGKS